MSKEKVKQSQVNACVYQKEKSAYTKKKKVLFFSSERQLTLTQGEPVEIELKSN